MKAILTSVVPRSVAALSLLTAATGPAFAAERLSSVGARIEGGPIVGRKKKAGLTDLSGGHVGMAAVVQGGRGDFVFGAALGFSVALVKSSGSYLPSEKFKGSPRAVFVDVEGGVAIAGSPVTLGMKLRNNIGISATFDPDDRNELNYVVDAGPRVAAAWMLREGLSIEPSVSYLFALNNNSMRLEKPVIGIELAWDLGTFGAPPPVKKVEPIREPVPIFTPPAAP